MKTYLVGGAVRDEIMGMVPKDRDYVVVGSTVQDMLDKGFIQVGKDFPVFIHPETGEEYALARNEYKTGKGYHGFSFDTDGVTIEADLQRRDCTINAMAKDMDTGVIIDPYNGQEDIKAKVLRPVSDHFKDDPIRVLRAFRFHARFGPDWTIDGRVELFHNHFVNHREYDEISMERYEIEVMKALKEPYWYLFFNNEIVKYIFEVDAPQLVRDITHNIDNDPLSVEQKIFLLMERLDYIHGGDYDTGWMDALPRILISKEHLSLIGFSEFVWDMTEETIGGNFLILDTERLGKMNIQRIYDKGHHTTISKIDINDAINYYTKGLAKGIDASFSLKFDDILKELNIVKPRGDQLPGLGKLFKMRRMEIILKKLIIIA